MGDFDNKNLEIENVTEEIDSNLSDKVIKLSRVAKVVKGGRRFSFSALVAVGDKAGKVGLGFGKANEVSDAIAKATNNAKKNMITVYLTKKKTIPHEVIGEYKTSKVIMRSATPGTGVIAGGAVRSIMEVVGVTDVLAKILGSKNQLNVAKATLDALTKLRNIKAVTKLRGKNITDLF
ncbi:MAG TPA: 30S ribosomal protein S5 [Spirochaetota bacterium]|nr:30S ribosomal protein S5 [Spirochaetota bacterium]HPP03265.1 30S ribosomal protein S5 [Spirochaetota bacterium]